MSMRNSPRVPIIDQCLYKFSNKDTGAMSDDAVSMFFFLLALNRYFYEVYRVHFSIFFKESGKSLLIVPWREIPEINGHGIEEKTVFIKTHFPSKKFATFFRDPCKTSTRPYETAVDWQSVSFGIFLRILSVEFFIWMELERGLFQ